MPVPPVADGAPLPLDRVEALLAEVRERQDPGARRQLVEHNLDVASQAAQARGSSTAPVEDLFQEGAATVIASLDGYAAGTGPASGLRGHLEREVGLRLDQEVERLERLHRQDERFAADAEQLERMNYELRARLGRVATPAEAAAALEWTTERVVMVTEMIREARSRYDEEIAPYLDDEES